MEKAFLFGIDTPGTHHLLGIEDSLEELKQLSVTAGLEVEGSAFQRLPAAHNATYMGSGKLEELREELEYREADTLVINDELSPAQLKNIENGLGGEIKIIDRTTLILDIFSRHARSRAGQLQVALAQYEYFLPRLTRLWTHLARQSGGRTGGVRGGVGLRGPGETQLESDRRQIRKKISSLRRELAALRAHRENQRKRRKKSGLPLISFVGYTNTGKSTLLKTLSKSDILAQDQLFSTLDPTTRKVILPSGLPVLMTDTVGFIERLPHNLVQAFHSTLEGIREADLILHVADITYSNPGARLRIVNKTLTDIGINNTPVLTVWNKADRAPEHFFPPEEGPVISALRGKGLDSLLGLLEERIRGNMVFMRLAIPYSAGKRLSGLYSGAFIQSMKKEESGYLIEAYVHREKQEYYNPFLV